MIIKKKARKISDAFTRSESYLLTEAFAYSTAKMAIFPGKAYSR